MKTDKKTIFVITATVVLAILAIFGAWRLYALRSQAIAPTAPKLVPAQEVASCPAVSFTVGSGCPVANSTCCLQPLTACDNSLQCGTGYICYLGYCVKQTYDERTNTCPAVQAPGGSGPGGSFGGGELSDGGGQAPAGGTTPGASPSPSASPRPSASPSPSPSPSASPKAAAGATSSPSPSSTQTTQTGTSTSAPSATTKAGSTTKAQEKLPEAGVSWPFTVVMGSGLLLLVLGIILAF